MPTIARVMGAILLHLSHVVPFVSIIIASRPPPPPPPPSPFLLPPPSPLGDNNGSGGFGTTILSRFLATSQEWAMGDTIWWRNALGLCIFLVVKDALQVLHLRLANAQLERRIKNKPFSGVDLTRLDLIERHT